MNMTAEIIAGAAFLCVLIYLLRRRYILSRSVAAWAVRMQKFFIKTSERVVLLNEDLVVIAVSHSLPGKELVGKRVQETLLWPASHQERTNALEAFRRALAGDDSTVPVTYPDAEGHPTRFEVEVFPLPLVENGILELACVAKDVSREMGSRRLLEKRERVENLVSKIAVSAFSSEDLRDCIPGILRMTGEFLEARRSLFFQFDRKGTITWEHFWSPSTQEYLNDSWKGLNAADLFQHNMKVGYVVMRDIINNPRVPETYKEYARKTKVGSLILSSLAEEGGPAYGLVGFSFDAPHPPDDESVSILMSLLPALMTGLLSKIDAHRDMELYRQSVEAAGQGIALIAENGVPVWENRAHSVIFGRKDREAAPIWKSYEGSYASKVRSLILPLARDGQNWSGDLRVTKSDGSAVDTLESFHPIISGPEAPRYVVNITTDITDHKKLEAQLVQAKREADSANRAKSDYLASMSHEIRTPMNAVIGLTYLALQTNLSDRQHDYLSRISTATKSLLAIINDILDLSKIESGKLELEQAPFLLDDVIENIAGMMAAAAWKKGLRLLYHRSSRVSNRRVGDKLRLGQVLLNLVGNAVKFTETGYILIRISEPSPGRLKFAVEDTGIGMNGEQLGRLFRPFIQAEASTSRRYGGTGLGLTISKQIVELMGGVISADSRERQGSRFQFTAMLDIQPKSTSEQTGRARPWDGKSAFVVCSDPVSADIHSEALHAQGFRVTLCPSMKSALENPSYPNVTLLDAGSCGPDPRQAAFALSSGGPDDFILIISGDDDGQTLSELAPGNVETVAIPLPYGPTKLEEALDKALTGRSADRETATASRPDSSMIQGYVLLVDDNEINRQVGLELLKRAGLTVDIAEDGRQAIEACRKQDYQLVLMDIQMPGMNGYQAAAEIRESHPNLPIIAMTASALNDIKPGMNGSFTDYVSKPIDPEALYLIVGSALGIPSSAFGREEEPKQPVEDERLGIPGVDEENGLRQLLGNREKYLEILLGFAEDNVKTAARIRSAAEDGDFNQTAARLHSLRGSSGIIGASEIKNSAGLLEDAIRTGAIPEMEDIHAFCESLNSLTAAISSRLEQDTSAFLDTRFGHDVSELSAEVRNALDRWDFDNALTTLEAWHRTMNLK